MILNLTIIEPIATPINSLFFALLLLTIVCGVLAYLLLTNRLLTKLRISSVLGMLAGFVSIVSLGALIFSFVHSLSIRPIAFQEKSLTIGSKTLEYKEIKSHYIKPLFQQSRYSAQINTDTALVYVIETKDGKSLLLSNDNYNLKALKGAMSEYVK